MQVPSSGQGWAWRDEDSGWLRSAPLPLLLLFGMHLLESTSRFTQVFFYPSICYITQVWKSGWEWENIVLSVGQDWDFQGQLLQVWCPWMEESTGDLWGAFVRLASFLVCTSMEARRPTESLQASVPPRSARATPKCWQSALLGPIYLRWFFPFSPNSQPLPPTPSQLLFVSTHRHLFAQRCLSPSL